MNTFLIIVIHNYIVAFSVILLKVGKRTVEILLIPLFSLEMS